MLTRYLDPKNDLCFKKIFGDERHKAIPIDFLNAVFRLKKENKIIDLQFLNPQQTPEIDARKESIVDVLVQDQKGIKFIVEMQVAKVEGFEKRAQFYAAKTYCAHFKKGQKYEDLKKVIFLAITDYIVFPKKTRYKSNHFVLDNHSYENDLKDFSFTFVELPKFTKSLQQLSTIEEKWYYFLKHADESYEAEDILSKHGEIQKAYKVLDSHRWTEEEVAYYDQLNMSSIDLQCALDAAKKEGNQEGRQKGLQEGIQKGLQEGRQKGLQEGIQKGNYEQKLLFAKRLLKKSLKTHEIAELTKLTEKEILSLEEK